MRLPNQQQHFQTQIRRRWRTASSIPPRTRRPVGQWSQQLQPLSLSLPQPVLYQCRNNHQSVCSATRWMSTSPKVVETADISCLSTIPPSVKNMKVLVANRGEIACRVMKTCRQLGVQTVAVYSTADGPNALHCLEADEAYCVGTEAASDSYLDEEAVLRAVQQSGASAVHPGYGFMSENLGFCQAVVQEAGAVWLGPPPDAVAQMGDKIAAKALAEGAGVSCIPGYDGVVKNLEHALELCNNNQCEDKDTMMKYPVLLKAAAGGGGKGMRVCYNDDDLIQAWEVAKAEAVSFFKDDRLLLEQYIEEPHHIEFQVMCCKKENATGAVPEIEVVVFPERECSIQRRNQKIIEESPSVHLKSRTRQAMAAQVARLCRAVGYESAGTVEFLVDKDQNFYFLEMNTRLQVEHPVTEAVCGVDLVKAMLWVGAGEGLPEEFDAHLQAQQELVDSGNKDSFLLMPYRGHSIEARIYAEDPLRDFLPSTGPLLPYKEPETNFVSPAVHYHDGTGADNKTGDVAVIRVDSGVAIGTRVTPHYDPMLSKVISYSNMSPDHGSNSDDRDNAIAGLRRALDDYVIEGVQHNARLVQSVLRHPAFCGSNDEYGNVDIEACTPTNFLPLHYPDGFLGVVLSMAEQEELAVAAALLANARRRSFQQPPLGASFSSLSIDTNKINADSTSVVVGLGGIFGDCYRVCSNGDSVVNVKRLVSKDGDDDERAPTMRSIRLEDSPITQYDPTQWVATVCLDGVSRRIQVVEETISGELRLQMYGADLLVSVQSLREYELTTLHMKDRVGSISSRDHRLVRSPMPGTLVRYSVGVGDRVVTDQELCVVEAMKMQNVIQSHRAGTVASLGAEEGMSLQKDQVLLEFEVEES